MKEMMVVIAGTAALLAYLVLHFNSPQMFRAKLDPTSRVNAIAVPHDPSR